jgi:hypothetical protein
VAGVAGLIVLAVWAVRRVRGPALFFLSQALVPWLLALSLSTLGSRPRSWSASRCRAGGAGGLLGGLAGAVR